MNLHVTIVQDWRDWHDALLTGIAECERRNPTGFAPELTRDLLERRIERGEAVVFLVVDTDAGRAPNESVVGMIAMDFPLDMFNTRIGMISVGWAKPGYYGKTMDIVEPHVVRLCKEMDCRMMAVFAHRQHEAYEEWVGKWQFKPGPLLFTRSLIGKEPASQGVTP